MGQILGNLARYAARLQSIMAMLALVCLSVGYSIFITEMTRGGPEAAARFAALSLIYGALASALGAAIVFVLARRFVFEETEPARARLGAFVGVSFGLFAVTQIVNQIWQSWVALTGFASDAWFAGAMPWLVLIVLLFPIQVWRVALACGAREPTFAESWAQVWKTQWLPIAMAFLFAAIALIWQQGMRELAIDGTAAARVVRLTVLVAPSAIATTMQILLEIIAFKRLVPSAGQDISKVFA
jgi:hypothetical protein